MNAIGIDLGTTKSAVAIAGRNPRVLPTRAGDLFTPSVVGFVESKRPESGEIVVGRQALNNAKRNPINTVFSVKRLMGRNCGDPLVEQVRHAP